MALLLYKTALQRPSRASAGRTGGESGHYLVLVSRESGQGFIILAF